MKPQPEPSSREVLAGLIERVTYHNDGNGYCVLRINARGHRKLVTEIGHAAAISAVRWDHGVVRHDMHRFPKHLRRKLQCLFTDCL